MYEDYLQYCFVNCLYYFTLHKMGIFVYLSLVLHPTVFDTCTEPWNVFMYVNLCMYVCMLSPHSADRQFCMDQSSFDQSIDYVAHRLLNHYVMCGKYVCRSWCPRWCLSGLCSYWGLVIRGVMYFSARFETL